MDALVESGWKVSELDLSLESMAETRAWEQRYAVLEAMVADLRASMKQTNHTCGSDHFKRSGEYRRFGEDDRGAEEGHLRGGGRRTYGSLTRLTKIEFPRFNGENVRGWVFKAEEFFGVDLTPPDLKVKMAAIHFDDFASQWHQNFIKSDVGMSVLYDWKSYVYFLRGMFEDEEEDPLAELKKLQETDGIRQYHQKFENIRTRLRLLEEYLVSVYLAGLRLETRRYIKMFQPQTVRHCFFLGKTYEKAHLKPHMTANWSPKSVNSMGYSRDQRKKTVDVTVKTNLQPTKRLSQQEMNDRRSKDLCYLCDEKYTPEHYAVAHKKTQLFCMGVEDEFEDAEEKLCEVEEVVNNTRESMPRISVNAVSGISDYDTMRAEEPPKSAAEEVQVQPIELVVRDRSQEAKSDVDSSPGPGKLEQVMVIDDVVSLEKHCVQVQENGVQHEKESRLEVVTDKKEPMVVDTSEVEHKTESFPFLKFAAGQHLLWMQNMSEPILIVLELEIEKKKLCYKNWKFKYKQKQSLRSLPCNAQHGFRGRKKSMCKLRPRQRLCVLEILERSMVPSLLRPVSESRGMLHPKESDFIEGSELLFGAYLRRNNIQQKRRKEKGYQSWKFKRKSVNNRRRLHRHIVYFSALWVEGMEWVQTIKQNEYGTVSSSVWHRWRYKLGITGTLRGLQNEEIFELKEWLVIHH